MRTRRRLLFASVVVFVAACGSRTGLLLPLPEEDGGSPDAKSDVIHRPDAMPEEDAGEEDALPPLDVRPPIDVIVPSDCPDAGSTFIYVITESNNLYSFYPPDATFTKVGTIDCPAPPGDEPFSMAVDRKGIAYIVFDPSGQLFRVSTATAACEPTGFVSGQGGFSTTFGMGFAQNDDDGGETLYVAGDTESALGTIDVDTFKLTQVGAFNPSITMAELTGTGAGGLFGFWDPGGNTNPASAIVQIDKATAQVTNSSTLPGIAQGTGWAFGFWGGEFYTFTAPGSSSVVNRFDPSNGSVVQVAESNEIIVGAGVSTCAPQQ